MSGRRLAARLAVRRGEWVHLRRRVLGRLWLWVLVFVVGGTVVVSPRRVARVPALEVGEIAPVDVVVDRDTSLPDVESTEQRRQRAAAEVLPVWMLDPGVAGAVTQRLRAMFAAGVADASGSSQTLAQRLSEASGLTVKAEEARALRQAGFDDDLAAVLVDIVTRLYRQGVVADRGELLQSSDRGIVVRTVGQDGESRELDVYRYVDTASLPEVIEQRLAAEPIVARGWRAPLAALLARSMPPNLAMDRGETLGRRLRAASEVEEVVVNLPRGKIILRRGDEVTPQAARLLHALAARAASTPVLIPRLGVLLLLGLMAAAWILYLRRLASPREDYRVRFGSVALLTVGIAILQRGFAFLAGGLAASVIREPFGQVDVYLPALPHAVGPILAGLMFGLPDAVLFAAMQALLVAVMLGGDAGLVVFAMVSGIAAAFASQRLKERNVLARVGLTVAGVNALAVVSLALVRGNLDDPAVLGARAAAGAVGGVIAAALASFLVPAFESLTGTITDIRLLELSNPNLPLLKKLATTAPGTFQHSLAMANLAEAAAEAIGANPLLARVCCYYHDIGKVVKPEYFVENQRGENPHDHLTPWMSALVVSNHVKAGLELAREHRLPEPIREAITTHHGTKLIRYFYSRAKELETPDHGEVQETEFRYPGPKPRSKEMGVIMLADAIEAAARTLQEPTPGRIQGMIDMIIKNNLEDGQLDECELTLKDIERISAAFFWVLTNSFHGRVDYPGFEFNRRASG